LDETIEHSPGPGEIILRVDEEEWRWPVHVPDRISAAEKRVRIV